MPLRLLTSDDLETILQWRNSPSVRFQSRDNHVISLDEHREWFRRIEADSTCRWFVFVRDGRAAGVGYVTKIAADTRTASWGFYKAPDAPPGTGTMLCKEVLAYVFSQLPVDSVAGEVLRGNKASIRVHEKLGFRRDEAASEEAPANCGEPLIRFRIRREDWSRGVANQST